MGSSSKFAAWKWNVFGLLLILNKQLWVNPNPNPNQVSTNCTSGRRLQGEFVGGSGRVEQLNAFGGRVSWLIVRPT